MIRLHPKIKISLEKGTDVTYGLDLKANVILDGSEINA